MAGSYPWDHNGWWTEPSLFNENIVVGLPGSNGLVRINTEDFRFPKSRVYNVTSSANPVSLNTKNQFAFKTRSIGGWTGFITINMGTGPVTPKEHMLSSASAKIAVNSAIGTGGPWWLLQIWLNLHTIKVAKRLALSEADFPSIEPTKDDEGNEITTRRCMSFG
uniref:Aminotransferase-like n=1 Tax=Oryza barthii TaxID=65489 RepID=A0A679BCS3_9ORYZ|nr:aminotransferase-like [Oryza barthii]